MCLDGVDVCVMVEDVCGDDVFDDVDVVLWMWVMYVKVKFVDARGDGDGGEGRRRGDGDGGAVIVWFCDVGLRYGKMGDGKSV